MLNHRKNQNGSRMFLKRKLIMQVYVQGVKNDIWGDLCMRLKLYKVSLGVFLVKYFFRLCSNFTVTRSCLHNVAKYKFINSSANKWCVIGLRGQSAALIEHCKKKNNVTLVITFISIEKQFLVNAWMPTPGFSQCSQTKICWNAAPHVFSITYISHFSISPFRGLAFAD